MSIQAVSKANKMPWKSLKELTSYLFKYSKQATCLLCLVSVELCDNTISSAQRYIYKYNDTVLLNGVSLYAPSCRRWNVNAADVCKINSVDHLEVRVRSAGKPWILAFIWMTLRHHHKSKPWWHNRKSLGARRLQFFVTFRCRRGFYCHICQIASP